MSSLAPTAPASEAPQTASEASSANPTAAVSSTGATNTHMFQRASSTTAMTAATASSEAMFNANSVSTSPNSTDMKAQHSLELTAPQRQDSTAAYGSGRNDLNTHGTNTSFNGLNIEHFEMDELQKIHNDGVVLHPPTTQEINHILSEFPEGADILDERSKSSKTEEETETVHLQVSPNDSLTRGKHSDGANSLADKHNEDSAVDSQKIQAYAMLDFDSFTFYVQTMQILLGRMVEGDSLTDALDIHLGNQKAISRRHAKIFYNFGNQRFELSVLGRNGAFIDGNFVEKGVTVPLSDGTKIQIGETEFAFVLPKKEKEASQGSAPNDQIENLDSLVANFDEIKKDIQSDKLLMTKDPHVLDMVLDPDAQKQRELEIEKEIGKVLAREHPEVQSSVHLENSLSNDITGANPKKKSNSKSKSTKGTDKDDDTPQESSKAESKAKAKPKRQPKAKKKVYTLEEIPEQYRTKPNLPYSILITDCLRQKGTEKGMSLSEIYKGIQELYPYYFYCPDGWQSSVRHNLSLNKSFRKISKEGKGWLWGVNEEVVAEKDRARQKQLENAKAKGKTSSPSSSSPKSMQPPRQLQANLHIHNPATAGFKNQVANDPNKKNINPSSYTNTASHNIASATQSSSVPTTATKSSEQQGARSEASSNGTNSTSNSNMSANTKKALAYLQKELISLTKSRKMYDRATSTEILTKALAMTISQVDQAAKNFSIKGFPLVILIDKNPGHVTKILTAALNAATLQVCKQKGLTPHLPPKNAAPPTQIPQDKSGVQTDSASRMPNSKNAPESVASITPKTEPGTANEFGKNTNVPILHIKKENSENRDPIFHKVSTKSEPVQSTSVADDSHYIQEAAQNVRATTLNLSTPNNVNASSSNSAEKSNNSLTVQTHNAEVATSQQQNISKQATGPVVYQFAKASIKPSFKPAVKPISGASVKSFGPSHPNAYQTSIKPIKPVRLGGISGAGIIKPQFYAKGKSPSTDVNKNIANESISEEEEIKRSIAKFGKPTAKPITTVDDSAKVDVNVKIEVSEPEAGFASSVPPNVENTVPVAEKNSPVLSASVTEDSEESSRKGTEGKNIAEVNATGEKDTTGSPPKKTKEDGEGDDELDDELHMMLADLEKEEEHEESENKKRTLDEMERSLEGNGAVGGGNNVREEESDGKRVKTD